MKDFAEQNKKLELIHEKIFPILCEIDRFCNERNIRYYLCAGTCLGAVRHHGFIPWDPDADIMFPREEYERFIHEYQADADRKYEIGALEIDSDWNWQFGRVWDRNTVFKKTNLEDTTIGAFVDIFPIDGFSDSSFLQKVYIKYMRLLEFLGFCAGRKCYNKGERFIPLKKILHTILKHVGRRFFSLRMNKLAQRYPYAGSSCAGVWIDTGYGIREIMERDIFEHSARMLFNGVEMSVPAAYDRYLKNLFGNYMCIPAGAEENSYKILDGWEMIFDEK